jgi:hypothetical protein
MYNFGIHHLVQLCLKILRKTHLNTAPATRVQPERAERDVVRTRAPPPPPAAGHAPASTPTLPETSLPAPRPVPRSRAPTRTRPRRPSVSAAVRAPPERRSTARASPPSSSVTPRCAARHIKAWESNCLILLLIMLKLMVKQRLLTRS